MALEDNNEDILCFKKPRAWMSVAKQSGKKRVYYNKEGIAISPSNFSKHVEIKNWYIVKVTFSTLPVEIDIEGWMMKKDGSYKHWHSSTVVQRITSRAIKTYTGTHCDLVGNYYKGCRQSIRQKWSADTLNLFKTGFPENWLEIIENDVINRKRERYNECEHDCLDKSKCIHICCRIDSTRPKEIFSSPSPPLIITTEPLEKQFYEDSQSEQKIQEQLTNTLQLSQQPKLTKYQIQKNFYRITRNHQTTPIISSSRKRTLDTVS